MRKIIPIFLPHQGCPQRCSFCHQPHITGIPTQTPFTPDGIRAIIETALQEPRSQARGAQFEVAFYGGTFTGLDLTLQKQFLNTAQTYVNDGDLIGIRLSTHPAMFDERVFELLTAFSITTIELGVQSFDNQILQLANRGAAAGGRHRPG